MITLTEGRPPSTGVLVHFLSQWPWAADGMAALTTLHLPLTESGPNVPMNHSPPNTETRDLGHRD